MHPSPIRFHGSLVLAVAVGATRNATATKLRIVQVRSALLCCRANGQFSMSERLQVALSSTFMLLITTSSSPSFHLGLCPCCLRRGCTVRCSVTRQRDTSKTEAQDKTKAEREGEGRWRGTERDGEWKKERDKESV